MTGREPGLFEPQGLPMPVSTFALPPARADLARLPVVVWGGRVTQAGSPEDRARERWLAMFSARASVTWAIRYMRSRYGLVGSSSARAARSLRRYGLALDSGRSWGDVDPDPWPPSPASYHYGQQHPTHLHVARLEGEEWWRIDQSARPYDQERDP